MRRLLTILLCLLWAAPALAQFNGTNGIYALNHMTFGVMTSPLTVVAPGTGYHANDVLTLDCPNIYTTGTRPTVTVTSVSAGLITGVSLLTPGFATQIPSTGLAGQPNGVCNFTASGGAGFGAVIYGAFGFNAATLNGSNTGGGGGLPTAIYATHALLLASTTSAPAGPFSLQQQGYTTAGDGGAATYIWSANSYCPNGTSGSPVATDNIVCFLPGSASGTISSTPGRYLLQIGTTINALAIGFAPTTPVSQPDNYPAVSALMTALGSPDTVFGGNTVIVPPIPGQDSTTYWFSRTFVLSRGVVIKCGDGGVNTFNGVNFVFGPGWHGITQEDNKYTADGGAGNGSVQGCGIISGGTAASSVATPGSATITGATIRRGDPNSQTPISNWAVGDGVIVVPQQNSSTPATNYPVVPMGTVVSTVNSPTSITLNNAVSTQFAAADANFDETGNNNFVNGDVLVIGNNTYTFVNVIGSTPGNVLLGTTFLTSGTNLVNCINNNATNSTCVATSTPNVTADKPYANAIKFWALTGGTGGNSLTSTYTAAGTSAGHFLAALFAGGTTTDPVFVIDLPGPNAVSPSIAQNFTVNTTSGSNTVLVTAGPRFIAPGEWISDRDFPLGTLVGTVRGTAVFTQSGSNNFVAGDTIASTYESLTNTYTMVTTLVNPGNVLIGPDFHTSANNLNDAINRNNYHVTTLSGNVTSGVTTSVTVGACPTLPSVNEVLFDLTASVSLGPGTCSATTFTFATTALGNGSTADSVNFRNYLTPSVGQNEAASFTTTTLSLLGEQSGSWNGSNGTATYTAAGTPAGVFDHATFADQTITMDIPFFNGTGVNASGTHTGDSMWSIPAGLKRDVTANSQNNSFSGWPIGLLMPCEGAFLNGTNCTFSSDSGNLYEGNMFGRVVAGNNTSGSSSITESGAKNFGADLAEFATLSSTYVNFNAHSPESGGSTAGILENCSNLNGSIFNGGYIGIASSTYGEYPGCSPLGGNIFATGTGGFLFISPADGTPSGAPIVTGNRLTGNWESFSGQNGQFCSIMGSSFFTLGFGTNQCSNSTINWGWAWNTTLNSWDFGVGTGSFIATSRDFAAGTGYTGYTGGAVGEEFPLGLKVWNYENAGGAPNSGRILSIGSAAPTGTWHLGGDAQHNATAVVGGNALWVNVPNFSTTLTQNVIKGTSQSGITLTACPSPALTGTVQIIDTTVSLNLPLGTLSTCSGTLALTTTALNNATSGDTIKFEQWEQAGIVQDANLPVVSSCGTSPAIAAGSNNIAGQFTMGTGTPAACTITFAHAYPNHAFCTVSPASSGGAAITGGDYLSAQSASAFTWTLGTGTDLLVFNYTCGGN